MVCHSRAFNFVLGPSTLQMNKDHDYNGIVDNQLRTLEHIGVLHSKFTDLEGRQVEREGRRQGLTGEKLEAYKTHWAPRKDQRARVLSNLPYKPYTVHDRLVDPYDSKQDLTKRVKSYLHANCAQCHVEAGGGNAAMEMDYGVELKNMRIVDTPPNHDAFGIANARLIAPGDTASSIIPLRMSKRGPGQMPPLATTVVDDAAVKLIQEWITTLKK